MEQGDSKTVHNGATKEILKFGLRRVGFKNLGKQHLLTNVAPADYYKLKDWLASGYDTCGSMSQITDSIGICDWGAASKAAYLKELGYAAVLNVCHKKRDDYHIAGYKAAGIVSCEVHFDDADSADIKDIHERLDKCYDFIAKHTRRGGRVVIHCEMGINRSPMVAAYYWMRRIYANAQYALKVDSWLPAIFRQMETIRPVVNIWNWFVLHLAELEQEARAQRRHGEEMIIASQAEQNNGT